MVFNRVIVITIVKVFKSDLIKYDLSKYFTNSDFQIWDLRFIYSNYKYNYKEIAINKKIIIINSKNLLKKYLKDLNENDLIIDPFKISKFNFINKFIKKNNIKIAYYNLGPLPINYNDRKNFKYIFKKIINSPFYFYKRFINFFITKEIKADFFFLVSNDLLKLYNKKIYQNSKIIFTHSFDFNRYLEYEKTKVKSIEIKDYIVFLDEGVVDHPDYKYLKLNPYCNEKVYYPEINKFFQAIEKKFNMPVVIAAHPKVDYKSNNFNRKIFINTTINLIKNSKLVLAHMSTAINYAVIYRKPIVFLNSNNYNFNMKNQINLNASTLKSSQIDISKEFQINSNIFDININAYKVYLLKYITPNFGDKRTTWEIVSDKIFNLNDN